MMILILFALLIQDPAADLDRLVRDLGHELIEVRERAHRRLLEIGEAAVPALQAASKSDDAELRHRAQVIIEVAGRAPREKAYDADQKAALLLLRRNVEAERRPGSAASEGARFDLQATRFGDGWIITTRATDYLARHSNEEPGKGRLQFDVWDVRGADGSEKTVERCGRCSPGKVLVKAPDGPLAVRLVGSQVWFSPYHLEFQNPMDGQKKRVGDFTIEVAWPALNVTSERDFPGSWLGSMNSRFEATLKAGIELVRINSSAIG